ncbi:MAG: type II secretion system protein [Candidatus Moraniibacteriota bacterium]|nr:MAG: type II secretion system protein [Candidatus Moranbacteria bacterium]
MKQNEYRQSGFTLIELLLYVGIASLLLFAASIILSILLESRIKNQTIAEVEGQGAAVLHILGQSVRNASGINSPSPGSSASMLSLAVDNSGNNPTVFNIELGALRVKEGSSGAINLTNSRVVVSNLSVANLSRSGTLGTVRIEFTVAAKNTSGRNAYSFSKTFATSATLRQ